MNAAGCVGLRAFPSATAKLGAKPKDTTPLRNRLRRIGLMATYMSARREFLSSAEKRRQRHGTRRRQPLRKMPFRPTADDK
jgi:hypothetical protein